MTHKAMATCLMMAMALSACDKNAKAPEPTPQAPAASTVATPAEHAPAEPTPSPSLTIPQRVTEEAKVAEEAMLQSVGQACVGDTMCPRYLRCEENKCIVPRAMSGQGADEAPRMTFSLGDGPGASFALELAISAKEQQRGLMFRRQMKQDWGMLFIYPSDGQRSFWMRNTLMPLDMVFINSKGVVVNVIANVPPLTETPRPSTGPARYVLELGAGVANKSGIASGSRVTLTGVKDEHKVRP